MRITRQTRDMPVILSEIAKPRFVWDIAKEWRLKKNEPTKLEQLWAQQGQKLEEFNKKHPEVAITPVPALAQENSSPPVATNHLPPKRFCHRHHHHPEKRFRYQPHRKKRSRSQAQYRHHHHTSHLLPSHDYSRCLE
jgi:hypothetical protein